jgi:biotin-(acetyl-CoA carboxylase) ligase
MLMKDHSGWCTFYQFIRNSQFKRFFMIALFTFSTLTKSTTPFVRLPRLKLPSSSSFIICSLIIKRWSRTCNQINNKSQAIVRFAGATNVDDIKNINQNNEKDNDFSKNNAKTYQITEIETGEALGKFPFRHMLPSLDEYKLLLNSSSNRLDLHHIRDRPVSSTQDEARRILHEKFDSIAAVPTIKESRSKYVTIIADHQTKGRGTQGRNWESNRNEKDVNVNDDDDLVGTNLFLTVCIPLDEIPVMITLLPLKIAVVVAQRINQVIDLCYNRTDDSKTTSQEKQLRPRVVVKWPNDVLIHEQKISGTLIENELVSGDVWLLIGIGVNVAYAPNLQSSPGKQIRAACSIQDICDSIPNKSLPPESSAILGMEIASSLVDWVINNEHIYAKNRRSNPNYEQQRDDAERAILDEWKKLAQFGHSYEIRGSHVSEESNSYEGEIVTIIDIARDGQLLVENSRRERRLLVADYLF